MSTDPSALQWFLDDAKSQGLTLSEYERKYGLILSYDREMPLPSPAEQRIRRNENNGGLMGPEELETLRRASKAVTLEQHQARPPGRHRQSRVYRAA